MYIFLLGFLKIELILIKRFNYEFLVLIVFGFCRILNKNMWLIKTFSQLTTKELLGFLRLRNAVFIVEQKSIYQDIDYYDLKSIHIFRKTNGKIIAYARIYKVGNYVTFGRLVVAKYYREEGLGRKLLNKVMKIIKKKFPGFKIKIEAQFYIQNLYKQFGFQVSGRKFILDSIFHINMVHNPL